MSETGRDRESESGATTGNRTPSGFRSLVAGLIDKSATVVRHAKCMVLGHEKWTTMSGDWVCWRCRRLEHSSGERICNHCGKDRELECTCLDSRPDEDLGNHP